MTRLLVLGSAFALASCAQPADTAAEATPGATTAIAEPPSPAANQAPAAAEMAGTYEVTLPGGKVMTQTINADGTYVDTIDGEETRGKWRIAGVQACFDPDGNRPEECYTAGPEAANGSFVVTSADGTTTTTVRKIADAPAT